MSECPRDQCTVQIVLGSQLRTPVAEEEKEQHRHSMRRDLDTRLQLASLNNDSCESIETPVQGRRQVNHSVQDYGEPASHVQVGCPLSTIRIDNDRLF